jgi:dethiobiotin synthetase
MPQQSSPHLHRFISGTDTDVGKTFFTTHLARTHLNEGRRVAIYKPVQTGISHLEEGDAYTCAQALGFPPTLHYETTYHFEAPAAPSVCDEKGLINFDVITQRFQSLSQSYDVVLVEGAGGVFCPLTPHAYMVDLMSALKLPAFLVSRYTLGTLNHTLLSLEALTQRKILVEAVVLSEGATPLSQATKNTLAVRSVVSQLQHYARDITIQELPHQGISTL